MNGFSEFQKSKQYTLLLDFFDSVVYGNEDFSISKSDTAYIFSNVGLRTDSYISFEPEKVVFPYNTSYKVNCPHIFDGRLMLYTHSQYIGTYDSIYNSLYLIDVVNPFDHISTYIFDKIISFLSDIRKNEVSDICRKLRISPTMRLMVGDIVYNIDTAISNQSFWHKLFLKMPENCLRIDKKVYKVSKNSQQTFGLEAYKTELAEKAQKVIASYRSDYYDQISSLRKKYQEHKKSAMSMPNMGIKGVVENGLMLAVDRGNLCYMFRVDIKLHSVVSENRGSYKKLKNPLEFKGGLLVIKTSPGGHITGVDFHHVNRHPHIDRENQLCVGSASRELSNVIICNINDIVRVKSKIIELMSVCNVSSMFTGCWKSDMLLQTALSADDDSIDKLVISGDDKT